MEDSTASRASAGPVGSLLPPTLLGLAFAALLAALFCWASYAAFGAVHLNLADEGYLWYGVLRVLEGEVPFRDFQAYDPGRYYWTAALSRWFGAGILGVRAAASVFQALGLFLGILTARRLAPLRTWPFWTTLFALVLFLWMFPRHKLYEPAIAMAITWSLVRLLERPDGPRHLACGLVIGLAGWFGRNHALYGALAAAAVLGLSWWRRREPGFSRRALLLIVGGAVGYAPLWGMLVAVPGFAESFLHELASLTDKGTNVPRPYPWPWRFDSEGATGLALASVVARHIAFLTPPLVLGAGLWTTLRTRGEELAGRAVLVAGTLTGLFYLHHVAVRSDTPHLAQCIHPTLLVALALPGALGWRAPARAIAWCAVALLSVLVALDAHTSLRWLAPWRDRPRLVEQVVAGDRLELLAAQARYLTALEALVAHEIPPAEPLLIVPSRPTLYCVLGRRAPVHQIYFLWQASNEDQAELVRDLAVAGVDWVLVVDTAVDDRDELRFQNTHPIVWRRLQERFQRFPTPGLPADNLLLRRKR